MGIKPTHAYNFPPGWTLLEHHSHCHLCKPNFPIYFLSTGTSAVCKMESWLHLRVSERNSATLQETATVSYVKSKLLVTQSSIKSNSHLPPPLSVSINKKSFWKRKKFHDFSRWSDKEWHEYNTWGLIPRERRQASSHRRAAKEMSNREGNLCHIHLSITE